MTARPLPIRVELLEHRVSGHEQRLVKVEHTVDQLDDAAAVASAVRQALRDQDTRRFSVSERLLGLVVVLNSCLYTLHVVVGWPR